MTTKSATFDWEAALLQGLKALEEATEIKASQGHEKPRRARKSALGNRIMDPVRAASAGLLVFGFTGTKMDAHAKRLIDNGAGGFIIFGRNYTSPEQVAELCLELKKEAFPRKLLIMVDQEGGRVARLGPPFSPIPPARTIGLTRDHNLARAAGHVIGRELRAVHIDMDLAPVADVDTNPKNPVIGDRSFGSDPGTVGSMAAALIEGLQKEGVGACAKHFPGHGDTLVDSHLDLPTLPHSLQRLQRVELPPFKRAIEAGAAAVMVSHLLTPSLGVAPGLELRASPSNSTDADTGTPAIRAPASMSSGPVRYLRDVLGFKGMVVSDCLEMGAIIKHFSIPEAAVAAVAAGVDMVLVCHTQAEQLKVVDALEATFKAGRLPLSRLLTATRNVHNVLRTYCHADSECKSSDQRWEVVGCKEHQDLVDEINQVAAARSAP